VSLAFGFRAPVISSRRSSYDPDAVIAALFPGLFLDSGRNVTLSGGGGVAAWSSRTDAHNFVQAVEANQPTPVTDSGKTVLNFAVSPGTQSLTAGAETWRAGTDHTFALVFKPNPVADMFFADAAAGRFIVRATSANKYMITTVVDRATAESPLTAGAWQWMLMTCTASGGGVCQIWHNGTPLTALGYTALSFASGSGGVSIGKHIVAASWYYRGRLALFAQTPAVLGAADRAALSLAITTKYAAFGLSRGSLT
jgi:hypothetical protein